MEGCGLNFRRSLCRLPPDVSITEARNQKVVKIAGPTTVEMFSTIDSNKLITPRHPDPHFREFFVVFSLINGEKYLTTGAAIATHLVTNDTPTDFFSHIFPENR
ncbi:hypothetical protein Peur_042014 [Populus x canadensis]